LKATPAIPPHAFSTRTTIRSIGSISTSPMMHG
jgi:hypothetical protein